MTQAWYLLRRLCSKGLVGKNFFQIWFRVIQQSFLFQIMTPDPWIIYQRVDHYTIDKNAHKQYAVEKL